MHLAKKYLTTRGVVLKKEVGGCKTSASSQLYIKRKKWISYKEACGCCPRPTTPQ